MKLWLAASFVALAQASCYDYEYYNPDTGAAIAGNACNKQTGGQPSIPAAQPAQQFGATIAPGATVLPAQPYATGLIMPQTTGLTVPQTQPYATGLIVPQTQPYATGLIAPAVVQPAGVYGPTTFTSPVISTPTIYGSAQVPAAVYGPSTRVASQVVVGPSAPVVDQQDRQAELEYYQRLGQQQTREHRQNSRDVTDASRDLQRATLFNRVIAGPDKATPWFPLVRLGQQKRVAEAYRSEKQIANRNAQDAYQRYQKDPSRLNLLVAKYQDLNADLRDAAYQYNVVNSGTFGQRIASSGLFGNLGGGVFGGLTQILTQRRQSEDLQDIQRQMQRIARQIQQEARNAVGGASGAQAAQGSVEQRLMASTVYGPQQQQRRG